MKLSVIVPTYNRAHTIERALCSILDQVLPSGVQSMQLIVVDDGSEDDTQSRLTPFMHRIKYIKQTNSGVSAARNAGIEQADGDWIAFLDSDDEWLPNKLLKQFERLNATELLVCHTEEIWIRNGVRVNQMHKHQKSGGWIFDQCLLLCAMSPSSIIIHREVFDRVGVFDPKLPACEDYDLWLRITAAFEVAFVPEACIKKYGGHEDQLSRQYWGMDRFRVLALEKLLSGELSHKLSSDQRSSTLEILYEKITILNTGAIKHQNTELIKDCKQSLDRWVEFNKSP